MVRRLMSKAEYKRCLSALLVAIVRKGDYPVDKPNSLTYITLRNEGNSCHVNSYSALFSRREGGFREA